MDRDSAPSLLPVSDSSALPTFDVALRGYDRKQVDEYLDRIERDLAITQADRAAAVSHARAIEQRLGDMQRELQVEHQRLVEAEQPTYAGLGAKAEQFLRIAEEESTRLRAEAERDVTDVRAAAEAVIKEAERKAVDAERELEEALAARRQQADDEDAVRQAEAEQRVTAAQQRIAEAEALAGKRAAEGRAEAQRLLGEASALIEQRRAAAEQQRTELAQTARVEAEQIIAEAKAEAERIVNAGQAAADQQRAAHEKQIAALLLRRTDVSRQLKALREVLGSLPEDELAEDGTTPNRTPAETASMDRADVTPTDPSPAPAIDPAAVGGEFFAGQPAAGATLGNGGNGGNRPDKDETATLEIARPNVTPAEPTRRR